MSSEKDWQVFICLCTLFRLHLQESARVKLLVEWQVETSALEWEKRRDDFARKNLFSSDDGKWGSTGRALAGLTDRFWKQGGVMDGLIREIREAFHLLSPGIKCTVAQNADTLLLHVSSSE